MKRPRILILLSVGLSYAILILVYSKISYNYQNFEPSIAATLLGGFIVVWFGLNKNWVANDRMSFELINSFNNKFDNLNERLNQYYVLDTKKLLSEIERKEFDNAIQDYLNLCSEEYYWFKRGRIDDETWNGWKNGISYYLENKYVLNYFKKESRYDNSYYNFFQHIEKKLV